MGICTADSIINLALCCLGYIPGLLHAWYIILKNPEPDYDALVYEPIPPGQGGDIEGGRVRYYYVSHEPIQHPSQRGYGTVHPQPQQPPQNQSPAPKQPYQHQQQQQQHEQGHGEGSGQGQGESRPPPTYAEAVRGDNKVQTQD